MASVFTNPATEDCLSAQRVLASLTSYNIFQFCTRLWSLCKVNIVMLHISRKLIKFPILWFYLYLMIFAIKQTLDFWLGISDTDLISEHWILMATYFLSRYLRLKFNTGKWQFMFTGQVASGSICLSRTPEYVYLVSNRLKKDMQWIFQFTYFWWN